MKAWVVWTIILATLACLAFVKVGIHVAYEDKLLQLELIIAKIRLVLMGKDKSEKPKNPKTKKKEPAKQSSPKTESTKKKGKIWENPWVRAVLDHWQALLGLIGRVLTTPTLDILRLQIWVGGGDSEKCAMNYGRICAVLGGVLPVVENTFGIRKRQIEVLCCYDRDSLEVSAEASITVRIFEIFALAGALLGLGIKLFLQARNYKKAVQ